MDKWQQIPPKQGFDGVLRVSADGDGGEPGRIRRAQSGQDVDPVNPENGETENKGEYRASVNRPTSQSVRGWNVKRWTWLRAVTSDAALPPVARLLASALVTQFSHHETAHCAPGIEGMAEALGTSRDTVKRALRALDDAGWITRTDGRGAGRRLSIVFVFACEAAEKVVPIRAETGSVQPHNGREKGGRIAPFDGRKKGAGLHEKGGRIAPSHNKADPKTIQSARAAPERPAAHLARCIRKGSHNAASWDAWLIEHGHPTLAELDQRGSDAGGVGWCVPFSVPPDRASVIEQSIAERWAVWATFRTMERRHA